MAEPNAETAVPATARQSLETPAVEVVESATTETPTETTVEQGSEPTELGEKGKQEIITLRKRAQKAEHEAAYLRGLAEGRQPAKVETAPTTSGPPKLENFENYDDFLVAKAKHEFAQEQQGQEVARKQQQIKATYAERFRKAVGKYPDLPEVVQGVINSPAIPMNSGMQEAIMESEVGPEIVRHLGLNPQELRRIASLPPIAAAREIGRIEVKLSAPEAKTETKIISQAPGPIRAVGAKGAVTEFNYEKSSVDDFMKKRNAEDPPRRR